jgi:ABC-type transport system involved in multi-copper enzyme maturation permease subunit
MRAPSCIPIEVQRALYVVLSVAFSHLGSNPTPPLSSAAGQRTLLEDGSAAEPYVPVLGAIGITGELRHRTAAATFLATPRRARVLVAKVAAYGILGAGYGAVCVGVTLAIALPWLSARHIEVPLASHAIPVTLVGVVLAAGLFAAIGVGLGALVADQVAAVVVLLVYLLVIDPLLFNVSAFHSWSIYLPAAAADALTHVAQHHHPLLTAWQGGLVLAGYAIVLGLAGALALTRRDLT